MAVFHVLIHYIFLITLIIPMTSSSSDSEALLQLKKSLSNTKAIDSWGSTPGPCVGNKSWVGLNCENGLVSVLRLEDMGLSGKIDIDALLELEGLRVISLQNNVFSGLIPEFSRLGALKAIFLSNNKFSGPIPSNYFEKMGSLKKLYLADNNFDGPIPVSLGRLPGLTELHLENNQFSGQIPPLKQPSLVSLDLSHNNLVGAIPGSLSKFNKSSFEGNSGLCGENIGTKCDTTNFQHPPPQNLDPFNDDGSDGKIAAGLMTAAVVIFSIMCVAIFVLRKKQEKLNALGNDILDESVEVRVSSVSKKDMDSSSRRGTGSSRRGYGKDLTLVNDENGIVFGLTDLMKAGAEVLGNGSLGSSYKAMMTNGLTVVVKRIKDMNKLGRDGFDAEIRRLGRFRHPNVSMLLAYHFQKEEKLLVYEYIPEGSLLYLLHGDRGPSHAELNWPVRLKIVQGIARGLGYLHSELGSTDLPHGNLKSSNVLIGLDYEPLLVDYGFSLLLNNQQAIQALLAYKSPEAVQTHQVSPHSDVYCLGIVILEILTGKFPSQYLNHGKGGTDVVQWVKSAISERREAEVFDPEIATNCKNSLGEMERLLHIGAACTESNPDQRPNIGEVIRRVEEVQVEGRAIQGLPTLRHGYAETGATTESQVPNVQDQGYGGLSMGRRRGSFEERTSLGNSDSFAFDVS